MDMASSSNTMDPNLWGTLQQYIDLENVYLKLPLWSFFQLRGVCKEWNTLAQQRRCFTERIQKPYFVIVYLKSCPRLQFYYVGILTLQIASGRWRWKSFPVNDLNLNLNPPFSVNGLVLSSTKRWTQEIYNIHTKQRYYSSTLTDMSTRPSVIAMAVDTSVTPYKVQTIIGGPDIDTSIDNHDWLETFRIQMWFDRKILPSRVPAITGQRWPTCMKSCVQLGDCVYTWWQTTMICVYSLKEDKWTMLNPPQNDGVGGALGCWDNRLFVVVEDGELSVSVWELVDGSRQPWRQFARIPDEMHFWLVASAKESILASFCDRYVLMYTLLRGDGGWKGMHDHFVLFDLETKQWEKTSLRDNTLQGKGWF